MQSTITDEMIEAAAQAIRDQFGARSIAHRGMAKPLPWNALPLHLKDSYRAEARAALTAADRVA